MKRSVEKKLKRVIKMPTNEERREVAKKLRKLAGTYVTLGDLQEAFGIDLTSPDVDIERDE